METNRYLPLLGRILIGAPFMLSGLSKLAAHDATVGYISSVGRSHNWGGSSPLSSN
jgi:putative oxidoreductase